jgi:hypothetical protein
MAFYVIEFMATINGTLIERGKIGSIAGENDYQPNNVKSSLERHFRSNPNTKSVAVVFTEVKKVTPEEFHAEKFISLGNYE